ncbi:uncharacterized protein [Penaeus vannamei]|uniref:BZIP domain-containing protein n=1 Tax=Penaeus vannamei TaxID=6689 RepID=A0A3R7MDM8_PENVA|nr:uncharacterized protein LOC113817706 isoform X2 [Penaeus vannamei]ROT79835.1 hypothetical protein C7M84_001459 [Penaeus vannamei]
MSAKHTSGPEPRRVNPERKRRTRRSADPAASPPYTTQPSTSEHVSAAQAPIPSEELAGQSATSWRNPARNKLYAITEPFSDPEKERRRINAVTAKRNRDKKNMEFDGMCDEVTRLRHVNRQSATAFKRLHAEIQKLSAELQTSKQRNASSEEKLRQKTRELRDHREKFALFRGHLELIASILDDANPAKRQIAGLLRSADAPAAALPEIAAQVQ